MRVALPPTPSPPPPALPWLLLTCACAAAAAAFNLAPQHARLFADPRNDSASYFGFSVALRALTLSGRPQIVVGAPRARDFNASAAVSLRPGAVYVCDADAASPCVPLLADETVQNSIVTNNRENGGLGSAVVADDSSDAIMSCAPRWKSEKECDDVSVPSRPNGICYLTTKATYPARHVAKFYSFVKCETQIIENKYHYVFAEAGMSFQIVQNTSVLIVGAPGFLHWRGGVFRYRFNKKTINIDIPCPKCYGILENSYLGYSVGYGRFTDSQEYLYVSSAPRAADSKGKILIFNFEEEGSYWRYKIIKEREGTQLGEYFGASLCVVDINRDEVDDLLVGAPQHTTKQNGGDEGIVYILLSNKNKEDSYGWKDLGDKGILMGNDHSGARFGSAIASLGDMNMDGYPDIAVGAPYENNQKGAVYIYYGNRNGLNSIYSQRIIPSEKVFLRGFGSSISKGLDVDGNFVKDVAVGAYLSGHVVLIKSYPVVTIVPQFLPSPKKIPFTTEKFNTKICLSYNEKYTSLNVGLAVTLKVDTSYRRASFGENHTVVYNATLESTKLHCKSLTVFIKTKSDYSQPIEFLLEYKVLQPVMLTSSRTTKIFDNRSEEFCKSCVLMNPTRPNRINWNVPYVPDNAPADLNITAYFINVKSPYIIGTTKTIQFEVVLQNYNYQAIKPQIFFEFPLNLLKNNPKLCQQSIKDSTNENLELVCDVESPFTRGSKYVISNITLDMNELPVDLTVLNITISATSLSLEENEHDNKYNLVLPLEKRFNLEIHGKAVEYTLVSTDQDPDDNQPEEAEGNKHKLFKHNYQMINEGPSPATRIDLFFEIPTKILLLGVSVEVLSIIEQVAYLGQQPFSCVPAKNVSLEKPLQIPEYNETIFPANRTYVLSCSEKSVICSRIKCVVSSLFPRNREVRVSFTLKLLPKRLGTNLGLKDIILIKTHGYIYSSDKKYIEIQSVVWTKPPTTKVDFGMVAICIACGCVILFTFVLILIKCGFFLRQDPMERYFRKKAALALESKNIPPSTFYSPRGSIMVF